MIIRPDSTLDLGFQGKDGQRSWRCLAERFEYTVGTPNSLTIPALQDPNNCIRTNLQKNNLELMGIWHFTADGNYISMNVKQYGFLYFPIILTPGDELTIPALPAIT